MLPVGKYFPEYCVVGVFTLQFKAVPATGLCETSQKSRANRSRKNNGSLLVVVRALTKKKQTVFVFHRNPGEDMDKQRVVEHDQLIQEFEKLITDSDGILGVLEETLSEEYGHEANFEAKRLLCDLFQVQIG